MTDSSDDLGSGGLCSSLGQAAEQSLGQVGRATGGQASGEHSGGLRWLGVPCAQASPRTTCAVKFHTERHSAGFSDGRPERGNRAVPNSTGKFNLRISPELHERLAIAAQADGKSINSIAQEALQTRGLIAPPDHSFEPSRCGKRRQPGFKLKLNHLSPEFRCLLRHAG